MTHANLILGYLPRKLAGGELELDLEKAKEAVQKIAYKLNIGLHKAARLRY